MGGEGGNIGVGVGRGGLLKCGDEVCLLWNVTSGICFPYFYQESHFPHFKELAFIQKHFPKVLTNQTWKY